MDLVPVPGPYILASWHFDGRLVSCVMLISWLFSLSATAERLHSFMQSRHVVSEEEVQRTLIGLCRDLRGVALAFNSRTGYMMLFDWMYPLYMWTDHMVKCM